MEFGTKNIYVLQVQEIPSNTVQVCYLTLDIDVFMPSTTLYYLNSFIQTLKILHMNTL